MTGAFLACRFLLRRLAASLTSTLAIAGCLAPILVIWGLESGYVDDLLASLRADPGNLEIRLRGDRTLTTADIAAISALSGAGYLEPTTRSLSARVFVTDAAGGGRQNGSLLPSTAGDPLLAGAPAPAAGEAVVSQPLASRLGVAPGDSLRVATSRSEGAVTFEAALRVKDVLPAARLSGYRLLVTPALILAVEDFVDGRDRPSEDRGERATADRPRAYGNARLYADRLEAVAPLARSLEGLGYYVDTEAAAVGFVLSLDRAAGILVMVFGGVLTFGAAVSLWSALDLALLPQRRHLALLVLMGGHRSDLAAYVLVQAAVIGGLAILAALAGFAALASVLNPMFAASGSAAGVCRLSGAQIGEAAVAAATAILTVAAVFVTRVWSIDATGALRDES